MPNANNASKKIQRVSRVIYVLLKIAFVAYIVYGSFQIVTILWIQLRGGVDIAALEADGALPLFVWEGAVWRGAQVFMPVLPYASLSQAAQELVQTVFTVIALGFGARTFRMLREADSPFRPEVVAGLKRLAIALLLVGVFTGAAGFLAAGIAWVVYMAFDYGCALQNESDTTL